MNNQSFNPGDIGIPNGNFFGFPYTIEESKILFLPVPWDVTTSYGAGSSQGPQAILDASVQLDFYDFDVKDAWKIGHGTLPFDQELFQLNFSLREKAEAVIRFLETGGSLSEESVKPILAQINEGSEKLNNFVYGTSLKYLEQNKFVVLVGGDHSTPLGLIKALSEKYQSLGILHIDAHADLRKEYEGFTYSHASIMYNVLNECNVETLTQVGIRDLCDEEIDKINSDNKIHLFDDFSIKDRLFNGICWDNVCQAVVKTLPENVYISLDIDGLNPSLCPNTGTPVPGGLEFNQLLYLIKTLITENKKIVGFDLNEVAPGNDEWDANVGARLLYKISNLMYKSNFNS